MAEIPLKLEGPINGGGGGGGASLPVSTSENFSSKRQRRPSVRLGDIGDQQFDSNPRRTKQWSKLPLKNSNLSGKGSRTRPLMNIGSSSGDFPETLDGEEKAHLDIVGIESWKVNNSKSKQGTTKRVRSNWVSKVDNGSSGAGAAVGGSGERDAKYSGGEFRDFDLESSESPVKEQSPIQSIQIRARVSEERDHSVDRNGNGGHERCVDNGVRNWLNGLGLGRYAPVFEIHEVDDEILPLLTLEDLKDMGINAVGSRRKLYWAIQKLGERFS